MLFRSTLILINSATFLLLWIVDSVSEWDGFSAPTPTEKIYEVVSVSSNLHILIHKPWTMLSYMFVEFYSVVFIWNMLILAFFGQIFLKTFSDKQLLATYVGGGFVGFLFALIMAYPTGGFIYFGHTPAIIAIIVSITVYSPKYKIHIFSIEIPIILITAFVILMELIFNFLPPWRPYTRVIRDKVYFYPASAGLLLFGGILYGFLWGGFQRMKKDTCRIE